MNLKQNYLPAPFVPMTTVNQLHDSCLDPLVDDAMRVVLKFYN